jgi:hypothetical protein
MASNPIIPPDAEAPKPQQFKINLRNPADNPYQLRFCRSPLKRKIIRAGRRSGKTTGSAILAVEQFLKGKRVLYAAPTIDQVKKFWKEVLLALDEPIAFGRLYKNETEHIIEQRGTDRRIRAKTAFNAETLRGDYADLLILDEYQMMDETAWTEVGAPMLIDNNGDVVFIYTPPSLETRSASKARDPQHAAKMFKKYKNDPLWLCLHFPSSANPHLSKEGLEEVTHNMSSLAYRQEILAEDTEEIPGALWTRKIIEDSRVTASYNAGSLLTSDQEIRLRRIVVGIDPSGGNMTEVGIMTGGEGEDGHIYILHDDSMRAARPRDWATTAIRTYYGYAADRIIAERNYGGDMVEETIRNVDENVSYHDVSASRGKLVRAEPILALFQQNKMHLVCSCGKPQCTEFSALEEELVSYCAQPGQKSPNRLDAMVWVGTELSGAGALGLLDLFKSGRAEKMMGRQPIPRTPVRNGDDAPPLVGRVTFTNTVTGKTTSLEKVAGATSLAAVMTNDQTPRCPNCNEVTMQVTIANSRHCNHCGQNYDCTQVIQRPLGGRRIQLEK